MHFFSPDEIELLPKYVLFVLDTSGSMNGQKITQLKEAMNLILSELKPEDLFSLVEFNTKVKVWDVIEATKSLEIESVWGKVSNYQVSNPIAL